MSIKNNLIKPQYGKGSIVEIAPSILSRFGIKTKQATFPFLNKESGKYRQVILFIVDAFGYDHFEKYGKKLPVVKNIVKNGDVHQITSVFPTTTAAALTSIYTGLAPQEHGLPEWAVFFEEFDQVIETLPFRSVKSSGIDGMIKFGGKPEMLYKGKTIFQTLRARGVKSFVFTSKDYVGSAYTRAVTKGGQTIGFTDVNDLMEKLKTLITKEQGRVFFSIYWGNIDSAQHHYGPNSIEHQKALNKFFGALQNKLISKINTKSFSDTLMAICADHGQIKVNPNKTIYLNDYPEIIENLSKSKHGTLIPPTGSPRDVFLHVRPNKIKETIKILKKILGDKADIFEIATMKKSHCFGLGVSTKRFDRRAGNVLVLPRKNNLIWYVHVSGKFFEHLGIHGGATSKEMMVPFGYIPISKL